MDIVRLGRRDQRGQVTTGLVMIVTCALVALAFVGVALIGKGVNDKSKAQTAADAAALAGAGSLTDVLPNIVGLLNSLDDDLGSHVSCDLGREQAEAYAAKNDATLTDYCFDLARGEVEVSVRLDDPVKEGDVGPAEAHAVASVGLDLADCGFTEPQDQETEEPEPTGTPAEDPTGPPPPPPPPPDQDTTFDCGPLQADFVIDGETGQLHLSHVEVDGLEPSLVE